MAFDDLNRVYTRPYVLEELITMYGGDDTALEVLQGILDDLNATINSGTTVGDSVFPARTIVDAKCAGKGYYSKEDDTQNEADANIRRICNSCGGWGKVVDANNVIKQWTLIEDPKTDVPNLEG